MPATFSPFWLFEASGLALSQIFMMPAPVLTPSKKCKDSGETFVNIHYLVREVEASVLQRLNWYREELRDLCLIDSPSSHKSRLDRIAEKLAGRLRDLKRDVLLLSENSGAMICLAFCMVMGGRMGFCWATQMSMALFEHVVVSRLYWRSGMSLYEWLTLLLAVLALFLEHRRAKKEETMREAGTCRSGIRFLSRDSTEKL